jgi:hypothetical protein
MLDARPAAWYRDQGDGVGIYYMAAVRFWHWGAPSTPGAHAGCMNGLLWTKDVALVRAMNASAFSSQTSCMSSLFLVIMTRLLACPLNASFCAIDI